MDLVDNADAGRFELRRDGEVVAWLTYLPAGPSVILAHTEAVVEGEGLGGAIVEAAVGELGKRGKTVIPTCPFAAAYLQRHPELTHHIDPSLRR